MTSPARAAPSACPSAASTSGAASPWPIVPSSSSVRREVALLDRRRASARSSASSARRLGVVAASPTATPAAPAPAAHDDGAAGDAVHRRISQPSPSSPLDGATPPSPLAAGRRGRDHRTILAVGRTPRRRRRTRRRRTRAVAAGAPACIVDPAVVAEHRVGHVDAVVAHALGELEHLLLHLGLPLGVDLDLADARSPSAARTPSWASSNSLGRPGRPRSAITRAVAVAG